jgi:hypothetical protein
MDREELSRLLLEELAEALADLSDDAQIVGVQAVTPPATLEAGASFRVKLSPAPGLSLDVDLPANLAIGYLADEEAAVDEFRLWLHDLRTRLNRL